MCLVGSVICIRDSAGVILGMAVAAVSAVVAVGALLLRRLPTGGRTRPIQSKEVIGFAWPQAVANIAAQLTTLVLIVILAHSEDARAVALFGAAFAIAVLPSLIYNAFSFRFSPTIARVWHRGERGELHELLKGVTRLVAMVSVPLYAVAIALPGPLLAIYGSPYREGGAVLSILAASTLLNALAGPVERALSMTGRVKLERASNVFAFLAATSIGLALIPRFGAVGAALSVLSYAVLMNSLKSFFVWRTMRMHALSERLLGPLGAAAFAAVVTGLVERVTEFGSSLAGAALLGLALIGVYTVLLVRVIGISKADRAALSFAASPSRFGPR
jgi:O-antigen/teichoic acid export membrane protein